MPDSFSRPLEPGGHPLEHRPEVDRFPLERQASLLGAGDHQQVLGQQYQVIDFFVGRDQGGLEILGPPVLSASSISDLRMANGVRNSWLASATNTRSR